MVFQVCMSMMLMTPSLRLGVAITVRSRPLASFHFQLMPEPRCGMPGSSRSAIFLRTSRLTTWPLTALFASLREAPITSS